MGKFFFQKFEIFKSALTSNLIYELLWEEKMCQVHIPYFKWKHHFGSKMAKNFVWNLLQKSIKKWSGDENIYPRVLKHYLGPNLSIPKILRSAEISTLLGIFLTFCNWATFFFKNFKFSNLLNFQPNIWIAVRGKHVVGTYPLF